MVVVVVWVGGWDAGSVVVVWIYYLERRRHEDELQVRPARGDEVAQDDEEEVRVAVPLMDLFVCWGCVCE